LSSQTHRGFLPLFPGRKTSKLKNISPNFFRSLVQGFHVAVSATKRLKLRYNVGMNPFEITEEILPRVVKGLVENHDFIGVSDLGRRPLKRKGKTNGCVYLGDGEGFWPRISWQLVHKMDGETVIQFQYQKSAACVPVSQEVKLATVCVTFGTRGYFQCPTCGSRRCALYIGQAGYLACRICRSLTYESTRSSHSKPILRQLRRAMRLNAKSGRIKRISYAGKYTRRAASYLQMSDKWLQTDKKMALIGR